MRRARSRAGLTMADKDHLHHRLMRLGHGQRRAVLILWAWTALLSGVVLYPVYTGRRRLVPLGVAALGLLLYTFFAPGSGEPARASRPTPTATPPADRRRQPVGRRRADAAPRPRRLIGPGRGRPSRPPGRSEFRRLRNSGSRGC